MQVILVWGHVHPQAAFSNRDPSATTKKTMRFPMTSRLILALACTLILAGCGGFRESRLNPFNWFGRSRAVEAPVVDTTVAQDGRQLVADVIEMQVDPLPGGAIVRAEGRAPTQGYWDAELVLREGPDADPANPVYDFRIFPPVTPAATSTPQSRQVAVALYLSDVQLARITGITVQGANNARAVQR
jgi:hypothetical protein